jgi:thioesterase domain-containing protein
MTGAIADIYGLSALQQQLLADARAGVSQLVCRLPSLDLRAFARAWQRLLERYALLRTSFHWEGLSQPAQVVHREVPLPLQQHDWQGTSPAEQQARLQEYLRSEEQRGFVLTSPPLLRLALLRLEGESFSLVWTYHPLILDDDSAALVWREFLGFYHAFRQGKDPQLSTPPPFRDHVLRLQSQGVAGDQDFWRQALHGSRPTPLPLAGGEPEGPGVGEQVLPLAPGLLAGLRELAQGHEIDLRTLTLGAWAVLLSRHSPGDAVLCGVALSSRPPDREGSPAIGPFHNTLPLRIALPAGEAVAGWLEGLHARVRQLRQHAHSSLAQVRAWARLPADAPLFHHVVAVKDQRVPGPSGVVRFWHHRHNQPLQVSVERGRRGWVLRLRDAGACLDATRAARLLEELRAILARFVAAPRQRLGELVGPAPASPLVALQGRGSQPPLCFVHAAGGSALCYASLAHHLGPDQPVLAFETQEGQEGRPAPVEALAGQYLAALRAAQPVGPYVLGGWSMGGLVAFEMGRQLTAQGQEVRLLVLLDPPSLRRAAAPPRRRRPLLLRFARQLGVGISPATLAAMPPRRRLAFVLQAARLGGFVAPGTSAGEFRVQLRLYQAHTRAASLYTPGPYAGRVILFRAERRKGPTAAGGWERVAADLQVRVAAGSHHSLLQEPHVRTLARQIQEVLGAAGA